MGPSEEEQDEPRSPRDTFAEAFDRKGVDLHRPCPACGGSKWAFGDTTVFLQLVGVHGKLLRDRGSEAVPVWCERCGFMQFHYTKPLVGDSGG